MRARRPPRYYAPLAPLLLLLLLPLVGVARGAGVFELQVLEWSHWSRQLAGGGCCAGEGAGGVCATACAASFALCLREYQAARTPSQPNAPCSFGRAVSPPLGPDSFAEPLHTLALPFSFRWTRSFTLLLSAYAQDGANSGDNSTLIEEAWWAGMVEAGGPWQALVWTGSRARLTYRVRVQCAPNYYSATCTVFCRARNDAFGHYTCSETGTKSCLPGWTGDNCETPICKEGCNPTHGRCDQPGECLCRPGWRGELCAQCAPYPGCKHGYCNGSAWDCTCDTNWGGILCDQDLNYCGTHEPCRNGGVCENTAPDQYRCTCADGFSGQHCERAEHACAPRPCAHGVCELTATPPHFRCECEPGWAGTRCDKDVDDCASAPCRNGATCRDRLAGYSCDCAPGWTGQDCEQDVDECGNGLGPCVNALSCSNKAGGYECTCVAGWEGPDCDINVDDCASAPCRRGATCIDLVDSFHCACAPGYEGRLCDVDTDECASSPCRHGGECRDLLDAYDCICPLPYAGRDCEDERDWCASSPCANGATCYSARDDYYCHCASSYTGRNCTQSRALTYGGACLPNPCRNNGTCVPNTDGDGDYTCACVDGWIGKTCSVRAEEAGGCGAHVCGNGGSCVRDGDVWRCVCAAGWRGEDCTQPAPCRCLHGGECVPAQGGWACACPAGWGGTRCERALDGCASAPCRNSARCVGGAGWFVCECSQGWAGEDCSVAAACPACPPPAVCLTDATGVPRCVCPAHPPRLAQRCLESLGETEVGEEWGAGCPANTTWWWGCNVCGCSPAGPARCSRLWCGLPDCLPPATLPCRPDEVCVPTPTTLCVVPPCGALGECRRVAGRRVEAPPLPAPANCWPGAAATEPVPARCARARLLLARERLSLGAHVERACSSLRRSLALALWPRTPALALLCDIPTDDEDALDLALWAEEEDAESSLREAVRALSELVGARSLRHHALLGAATALRLISPATPAPRSSTPIAAPIAAAVVTLIIAAAASAAFWLRYKRNNAPPRPSCDEEKSNNLQNEENLRRYANPLREPPAPSVPRALYKAHNNAQDKRPPPEPLAVLV